MIGLGLGLGLSLAGGAVGVSGADLDFVNGRYARSSTYGSSLPTGWSFTRASTGAAQRADGSWAVFASGVARITDKGLLIEEARTNKVTAKNANPDSGDLAVLVKSGDAASTLTLVSDTAALASAGLSALASVGNVFKLDNSAGVAAASAVVPGTPGNTNSHTVSAFWRGSGNGQVRLSSSSVSSVAVPATYARRAITLTPASAGVSTVITADAGAVIYFTLAQLEEATTASSPIVTTSTGSGATRAADVASLGSLADLATKSSVTLVVEASFVGAANVAAANIANLNDTTLNNRLDLLRGTASTALSSVVSVSGVSYNPSDVAGVLTTGNHKAAISMIAGRAVFAADGVLQAGTTAPPSIPAFSRLSIGVNALQAGGWHNDYIRRVRILSDVVTDEQVRTFTA